MRDIKNDVMEMCYSMVEIKNNFFINNQVKRCRSEVTGLSWI